LPDAVQRVAVVILTWNGRQDTLACLESLARVDWPELDVIVADNGSSDGTVAAVSAAGYPVHVVENGFNAGFAAGNNAGIAAALARGADAVFVLNNDTEVPRGALRSLVQALNDDASVACVCPVVVYADAPDKLWFAGSRFDPSRARSGRNSDYELGRAPLPAGPVAIERAVGAAMLVRASVISELGAFAPELFYLHEDVDWSLRMRAAGWRILLVPDARIIHKVAASQGGQPLTPLTAYYGTRNDLEIGRRHGGLHGWRALRRELGCVLVHVVFALVHARGAGLRCALAALAGWRDYRLRRFGPRRPLWPGHHRVA
jgi:GT2 family glycosyltransferase